MQKIEIADAMNTYNGALEIIEQKNFKLSLIEYENDYDWIAQNSEIKVTASDPLRLLALVVIAEEMGDSYASESRSIYDEILDEFLSD